MPIVLDSFAKFNTIVEIPLSVSAGFKMWKTKKLNFLTQLSTNLLRRRPLPPPSTTIVTSTFKKQFSSSFSCFRKIEVQNSPFSFDFSASWDLENPRLHFGQLCLKFNLFCSVSSSPAKLQCWNCNAVASNTTPFSVCESCRSVQPVDHSVDYFQILGVEKKYDIRFENLEGKYKNWQKKLHPDLVHTECKNKREYAAEQSARVTDAYRTLTDPLSRAVYILKLEGVEVDEEERISDPELLAEIMEIREAVEEAADTQALNHIQAQSRKYEEAIASIQRMTYYKRANEEIIKKL